MEYDDVVSLYRVEDQISSIVLRMPRSTELARGAEANQVVCNIGEVSRGSGAVASGHLRNRE